MTSQAITPKTLSKCIYKSDFYKYNDLSIPAKKEEFLNSAFEKSKKTDLAFSIKKIKRNGKDCYTAYEFEQILLSRKLALNIRQVLNKSKSRNQITRQLVQHLKEGTSYRVYRLDIKSFYESIEKTTIKNSLEKSEVNSQTRLLIDSILDNSHLLQQCGLPRGLEFSPQIAELVLKDFDNEMRNHKDVFFYSRYVDDIIFITTGFEDKKSFLKVIRGCLPKELSLNYNKQKIIDIEKRKKAAKIVASFEYLGYKYSVRDTATENNTAIFREVDISLSDNRIKKIKTRISKSLYHYSKNGNFGLLADRFDFLTSNRLMKDKRENRLIATGIYFNNVNLTEGNNSLKELDSYLSKRVLGYSRNRGASSPNTLSSVQKRELLKFSFVNGYANNNYKRFSPNKLSNIKDAWRY